VNHCVTFAIEYLRNRTYRAHTHTGVRRPTSGLQPVAFPMDIDRLTASRTIFCSRHVNDPVGPPRPVRLVQRRPALARRQARASKVGHRPVRIDPSRRECRDMKCTTRRLERLKVTAYNSTLFVANLTSLAAGARRDEISRKFFVDITQPSSCFHHLLPVQKDESHFKA